MGHSASYDAAKRRLALLRMQFRETHASFSELVAEKGPLSLEEDLKITQLAKEIARMRVEIQEAQQEFEDWKWYEDARNIE